MGVGEEEGVGEHHGRRASPELKAGGGGATRLECHPGVHGRAKQQTYPTDCVHDSPPTDALAAQATQQPSAVVPAGSCPTAALGKEYPCAWRSEPQTGPCDPIARAPGNMSRSSREAYSMAAAGAGAGDRL